MKSQTRRHILLSHGRVRIVNIYSSRRQYVGNNAEGVGGGEGGLWSPALEPAVVSSRDPENDSDLPKVGYPRCTGCGGVTYVKD